MQPRPILGVNIPWWGKSYGHDLGRNQRYPGWPVWYRGTDVSCFLGWLKCCGVSHVRIWLFENGEGLIYDESGGVTGIDSVFQENVRDLVTHLQVAGMSVYWVLLDGNSAFRNNDRITHSILACPAMAASFVANGLTPIWTDIAPVVWAMDICNEPEALVTGSSGNWTNTGVSWANVAQSMRVIRDGLKALAPRIAVSVGSGWHECKNLRSGVYSRLQLDLDFYDFHAQREDAYVSGRAGDSVDRLVVLGELGVGGDPSKAVSREDWSCVQKMLAQKLQTALAGDYQAIFLWYACGRNDRDRGGLVYGDESSPALHYLAQHNGGRIEICPC